MEFSRRDRLSIRGGIHYRFSMMQMYASAILNVLYLIGELHGRSLQKSFIFDQTQKTSMFLELHISMPSHLPITTYLILNMKAYPIQSITWIRPEFTMLVLAIPSVRRPSLQHGKPGA